MNGAETGLDEIEAAYRRVSLAIYRALEDAYDFAAAAIVDTLERDQQIVNAAFFVLIFGRLEQHINRLTDTGGAASGGRSRSFKSRLAAAFPGSDERLRRHQVEQWYALRNAAAHGEAIAAFYNIQPILAWARELGSRLPDG